jgi:hypothetical protein
MLGTGTEAVQLLGRRLRSAAMRVTRTRSVALRGTPVALRATPEARSGSSSSDCGGALETDQALDPVRRREKNQSGGSSATRGM